MSALPSPLKSPTCTSTQVTFGLQVAHKLVVKLEPVESPTHHWPVLRSRPAMSALPSPLKSPTCTSTQVTFGLQVAHTLLSKPVPIDFRTHHWPVLESN